MYLHIHSTPMRLLYVLGSTYKSSGLKKDEGKQPHTNRSNATIRATRRKKLSNIIMINLKDKFI